MADEERETPKDYGFCPKCKIHCLYNDDAHEECMRCRGIDHSCDMCAQMGPRARERTLDWIKQRKRQPASQPNTVSFADLENFGKSLTSKFESLLQNIVQPSTSASAGKVQARSNGAGQAADVNPPVLPGCSHDGGKDDHVRPVEILLEEEDDDIDEVRSTWDYKRDDRSNLDDLESIPDIGQSAESAPLSGSESEKFVNALAKIISELDISDAVTSDRSKSRIQSSRCADKGPQALLPFDTNHSDLVDRIWQKAPAEIPLYRKSTKDRYKLTEQAYDKYLKNAKVSDEYLVQELEKCGLKIQVKNPKLPNRDLVPVERKLASIEIQSQLGMSCAVTQSWLLQFITSQVEKLNMSLQSFLSPDDYAELNTRIDLGFLSDVSVLAQDAALDHLDLHARMAAESKWARRVLWVDQTRWANTLKTSIKRFPTVGDGTLCGPELKTKLESYRLTCKALEASANVTQNKRGRGTGQVKRDRPPSQNYQPAKRPTFDRNQNFRGRGRGSFSGRGNFRGTNRGGSSSQRGDLSNNLSG